MSIRFSVRSSACACSHDSTLSASGIVDRRVQGRRAVLLPSNLNRLHACLRHIVSIERRASFEVSDKSSQCAFLRQSVPLCLCFIRKALWAELGEMSSASEEALASDREDEARREFVAAHRTPEPPLVTLGPEDVQRLAAPCAPDVARQRRANLVCAAKVSSRRMI
jgi:hypothetical protein